VHLFQGPAALNLHGTFRGSKLVRDLLVEHARDNHGNHLALARSQRVEAPFEDHYFLFLFTSGAISLQCDTNSIQQILITEWLGEEFNRPSLHGANTHRDVAMAGEKDDRNINLPGGQLA